MNPAAKLIEKTGGWHRWGYRLRLALFTSVSILVAPLVGFVALFVWLWTLPAPSQPCCVAEAQALGFEEVEFWSRDSVRLAGWYSPPANGALILLLHGYGENRSSLLPQAQDLAEAGYGVLLYDLRAHGESGGAARSGGWADVADVDAAIQYVRQRAGVETALGIYGFSIGGQVALRAAAEILDLRAVVADGPSYSTTADAPAELDFSARVARGVRWLTYALTEWRTGIAEPEAVKDVIGRIAPRPVLLIATGPPDGLEQLTTGGYYAAAGEPKDLWVLPEAWHGAAYRLRRAEYRQRLLEFYGAALLGGPSAP